MRIIAGRWRGRSIKPPPGTKTRPTADRVREAWMSALHFDLPDARVLDLFAGSGALGLEALSRGAAHVTFVDTGPAALRTIGTNAAALGADADTIEVVRRDALAYTRDLDPAAFDIVLADPPYDGGHGAALVECYRDVPFARILAIEHAAADTLPPLPAMRTRRYGDTAITFYTAEP